MSLKVVTGLCLGVKRSGVQHVGQTAVVLIVDGVEMKADGWQSVCTLALRSVLMKRKSVGSRNARRGRGTKRARAGRVECRSIGRGGTVADGVRGLERTRGG